VLRQAIECSRNKVEDEESFSRDADGKLIPVGVKVGDTILFGKYSGSEVELDGEEHLIMREEDILGVVEV